MVLGVPSSWPAGVDVLSIDLDVREQSPSGARQATRAAAHRLRGEARLYVKVDSTLRGPISALIEGALDGSGAERVVVAPAFPEQGRHIEHGRLRLEGQPPGLALSEVLGAAAEWCSVHDSHELEAVSIAWPGHPEWLLVGSGGLARRIAGASPPLTLPSREGAVLVIAGSPAAATQRQLERLPAQVPVLRTPPSSARDHGEAAAALVQRLALARRPGLLVLTGGQTARLVCARLGACSVQLLGEVQPGMPVGYLNGGAWHDALVVTKAGGFGGPDALLDALRLLGPSCLDTS